MEPPGCGEALQFSSEAKEKEGQGPLPSAPGSHGRGGELLLAEGEWRPAAAAGSLRGLKLQRGGRKAEARLRLGGVGRFQEVVGGKS